MSDDAFPLKVGDQAYRVSTDDDIRANRDALQAECDRLTVIANDMARLLLKLQWIEHTKDGVSISSCHVCNAIAEIEGHRRDCELGAVLRQAGVMP